jgi:AcrR family transcriptional regulator
MDPARRRGRPSTRSRDELLAATLTVAAVRGYDGLRFSDVAEATDVPISSLQYYFGSRDALVREAVTQGVRAEVARCEEEIQQVADPWQRMEAFIAWGIDLDDETRREGWLVWTEYWRAALRDPQLQADSADLAARWRGIIGSIVRAGIASAHFHVDGPVDDAIAEILALVDGLGVQLMVGDQALDADRAVDIATAAARRVLRPTDEPGGPAAT